MDGQTRPQRRRDRRAVAGAGRGDQGRVHGWGPGKYDPRHHAFDGTNIIPLHSPSLPIVIPPIYGLKGVGFETYTGDGPISYWNSYVGVGQMGGHGKFSDPRIGLVHQTVSRSRHAQTDALLAYQLQPEDAGAASAAASTESRRSRGKTAVQQRSAVRLVPPGTDFHRRAERSRPPRAAAARRRRRSGPEPGYAARSATGEYRTTPLRGLLQHPPYFHDGSAPDLPAVVEHYDQLFGLNLTAAQKADLVEYLKSL